MESPPEDIQDGVEETPVEQPSPRRQNRRRVFDLLVGVIIPILLLVFDPFVFKYTSSCYFPTSLALGFGLFFYIAIGLAVIPFVVWIFFSEKLSQYAGLFAGFFMAGALVSGFLGLLILPFAILGLFAIIGVLGFFPFLTAFVYFRNAKDASSLAVQSTHMTITTIMMIAGFMLALFPPVLAQQGVNEIIHDSLDIMLAYPDSPDSRQAIGRLYHLNEDCMGLCTPNISHAFDNRFADTSPEQRTYLREVLAEITDTRSQYNNYNYDCSTTAQ